MTLRTILFVSHSSHLYGAEQCLLDIVLNLPSSIRPIVLLPSYGPMTHILAGKDIEHIVVPFRGWTGHNFRLLKGVYRFTANIFAQVRIMILLRKTQIDMVYTNTLFAPIGALLSLFIRAPLVWHVHEFVDEHLDAKFDFGLIFSMKIVNRLTKFVVCNSNALGRNMSKFIDEQKTKVVYNGMLEQCNMNKFHFRKGISSKALIRLLIVGSINVNKGQYEAIMAVNELILMKKNVELIVVGSGSVSYVNELKKLTRQLDISERIKWEGFKINVMDYYLLSDILVVCSKFETFGRVAVEAMSTGCPVVAANTGGIPEIIKDGFDGKLYHTGEYHELAEKIATLIDDGEQYMKISNNSILSSFSRFGRDRYVRELLDICEQAWI